MINLEMVPAFKIVRAQTGTLAVDGSATLSNFPLEQILVTAADEILFYWTATAAGVPDTIDVEAILYDDQNLRYVTGPTVTGVKTSTTTKIQVFGTLFQLRISAKSSTSATDARILAAAIFPPPRRGGR